MVPIILENAIPKQYQDKIAAALHAAEFPWYPVHEHSLDGTEYYFGFSHLALNDGPDLPVGSTASFAYNLVSPILYSMAEVLGKRVTKILRIRIGLLLPSKPVKTVDHSAVSFVNAGNDAHIDFAIPHYTGLYYVTDSDGDTVVYNEKTKSSSYTELTRSPPKKGSICIFDGEHFHAASRPTNSYSRIVITFNFTAE